MILLLLYIKFLLSRVKSEFLLLALDSLSVAGIGLTDAREQAGRNFETYGKKSQNFMCILWIPTFPQNESTSFLFIGLVSIVETFYSLIFLSSFFLFDCLVNSDIP